MSGFEISIIAVVLAVCLYTSYTDVRLKKIGNRCTYGLVLLGLLCQGIFVYLGITTIPEVLWLLLGGLAVAFLMYYLGIWSPGDSKLFWGLSVALPPTIFQRFGYWRYPPFVLAVNTFVPYFLATMIVILTRTTWRQKWQVLKSILAPGFLLRFALSLLSFMGISALLSLALPFDLDYFATLILFVVLFSLFDRLVARQRQLLFLAPFALVSLALAWDNLGFYLTMLAITGGLFLVLRFFIADLGDWLFVQEIPVSELRKGLVPANTIVRKGSQYTAQPVSFSSFISLAARPRDGEVIMDLTPEGLSEEKVSELQALAAAGRLAGLGDKIQVQQSMPFAPIILVGVLITLLSRGVFIVRLIEWLGR
jgi:Flp pilus assembly protein protease CpaA